jgi:hypothetical protein
VKLQEPREESYLHFTLIRYDDKQILTIRKLQINDEYSQMCKADKEAEDDAWAS